jgi:hypothetical protein
MADDSWMEEFFTFPDDMDEMQDADEKRANEEIIRDVFCNGEGIGGQPGQGEVTSQSDIDLAVLPPWDWTVNTGQEYPIPTDDNVNVEPNAQWLITMESFYPQAQFLDIVQDQPWTNHPNMAIRLPDTYPEANTDIDDACLPTIQTVENNALFGDKATTTVSQNPFSSLVDFNQPNYDIQLLPGSTTSLDFHTTNFDISLFPGDFPTVSQFTHFDAGNEFSAATSSIIPLHQFGQRGGAENSMVRIDDAPKKRYLLFLKYC